MGVNNEKEVASTLSYVLLPPTSPDDQIYTHIRLKREESRGFEDVQMAVRSILLER